MPRLAETLLAPPASGLLLLLLATALRRRWPRTGRTLQVLAVLWLWLPATPWCGGAVLRGLETTPPLPATGPLPAAEAIVVLAAEADREGREYGGAVVGPMTLQRLRYAVHLHRRSGLPILCSGGIPGHDRRSLAELMADAATREFGVPVRWTETESANTWENAAGSAAILKAAGLSRVLLVTSAFHMPRAMDCFAAHGLAVVAAPTGFRERERIRWTSFLPDRHGLRDSCLALHELGGRIAYWFRG